MPLEKSTTTSDDLFRLNDIADLAERATQLGATPFEVGLRIPFFDQVFEVSPQGVRCADQSDISEAISRLLAVYVLDSPYDHPPSGAWVTYRELCGSGPLVSSFAQNTNKTITQAFASNPDRLLQACSALKGAPQPEIKGYDLAVSFAALPRIPISLRLHAADEDFAAQASLLLRESAAAYLDMTGLFTLGTYLAGRLISLKNSA